MQDAEQRREPDGILMLSRQDVRVGPALPAADGAPLDRQEVREPAVAVASRVLEQSVGSVGLVSHDVAQGPTAARPGIREVPGALARIEAPAARGELIGREVDGRREVRDRKSTRLNSSHVAISYAVFCS